TLFYALKDSLPQDSQLTLFFHHYDLGVFESLINNSLGNYDYYIIMPHFNVDVGPVMSNIPREKLIIMDKKVDSLNGSYVTVYQDFEKDIWEGLKSCKHLLRKYQKLTLVKSSDPYQFIPAELLAGYERFKRSGIIPCEIAEKFSPDLVR